MSWSVIFIVFHFQIFTDYEKTIVYISTDELSIIIRHETFVVVVVLQNKIELYLLFNGAEGSKGAFEISPRKRVISCYLLPIFSPSISIFHYLYIRSYNIFKSKYLKVSKILWYQCKSRHVTGCS